MRLKWTKRALQQLKEGQDYIARENPAAANVIAERITQATRLLLMQPLMGRTGRVTGTREWVVQQTPYLLAYTVVNDTLQILGVIYSKQDWPQTFH
ncbi:MAG: type II toxin-antitoxin system RelE/ParE family toxin [Gammaproteobacteria bacterium]